MTVHLSAISTFVSKAAVLKYAEKKFTARLAVPRDEQYSIYVSVSEFEKVILITGSVGRGSVQ